MADAQQPGPVNPALAAALGGIAERLPPERVDAVWLFPTRQLGARESGIAVLSSFPQDGGAGKTRTIHTRHYLSDPQPRGPAVRTDELAEQGTVPLDRIDRIIEGVLHRLDVPETPEVRETGGNVEAWNALLAELSGVALDPANQESLLLVSGSPAAPDAPRT